MNRYTLVDNIIYALTNTDSLLTISTLVLGTVLFFLILYLLISYVRSRFQPRADLPLRLKSLDDSDKILWFDKPGTQSLFSKKYRISSKPDFLTLIGDMTTLIEYKSRFGPVYDSDIVQAKASALSARSQGFPVDQIIVETSSGIRKHELLPRNDNDLYAQIEPYHSIAISARQGHRQPATTNRNKCRSCSYFASCRYQ